jgi:Fur family ferric uptake transcriptional regulator
VSSTADLEARLRGAGLKVTSGRVAVLRVLTESVDHPRVDDVIRRVRAQGTTISTQAAYDVCEALHRTTLARRLDLPGEAARYEARVGDDHHHLVCRGCGLTVDVDCAHAEAPCVAPSAAHGFAVDEAEVTFWGLCPACRTDHDHEESA